MPSVTISGDKKLDKYFEGIAKRQPMIAKKLLREVGTDVKRAVRRRAPNKHIRRSIGKRTEFRDRSIKIISESPDIFAWEFGYPLTGKNQGKLFQRMTSASDGTMLFSKLRAFRKNPSLSFVRIDPSSKLGKGTRFVERGFNAAIKNNRPLIRALNELVGG